MQSINQKPIPICADWIQSPSNYRKSIDNTDPPVVLLWYVDKKGEYQDILLCWIQSVFTPAIPPPRDSLIEITGKLSAFEKMDKENNTELSYRVIRTQVSSDLNACVLMLSEHHTAATQAYHEYFAPRNDQTENTPVCGKKHELLFKEVGCFDIPPILTAKGTLNRHTSCVAIVKNVQCDSITVLCPNYDKINEKVKCGDVELSQDDFLLQKTRKYTGGVAVGPEQAIGKLCQIIMWSSGTANYCSYTPILDLTVENPRYYDQNGEIITKSGPKDNVITQESVNSSGYDIKDLYRLSKDKLLVVNRIIAEHFEMAQKYAENPSYATCIAPNYHTKNVNKYTERYRAVVEVQRQKELNEWKSTMSTHFPLLSDMINTMGLLDRCYVDKFIEEHALGNDPLSNDTQNITEFTQKQNIIQTNSDVTDVDILESDQRKNVIHKSIDIDTIVSILQGNTAENTIVSYLQSQIALKDKKIELLDQQIHQYEIASLRNGHLEQQLKMAEDHNITLKKQVVSQQQQLLEKNEQIGRLLSFLSESL